MHMDRGKAKGPRIPSERGATLRQELVYMLEGVLGSGGMTARELALALRITERDVVDHLGHVQRSLVSHGQRRLVMVPSECNRCGFVFRDRIRLGKPGKCPECRSTSVTEPAFRVEVA